MTVSTFTTIACVKRHTDEVERSDVIAVPYKEWQNAVAVDVCCGAAGGTTVEVNRF